MPELPEVETIRRQLEPVVRGRAIYRVTISDEKITAPASPAALRRQVRGRRIEALERRGKYLRFLLAGGDALVVHLRMTGTLTVAAGRPRGEERRHLRLLLELDDGTLIAFHDQRRFGRVLFLPAADAEEYWQRLGPEPLSRSFTAARLGEIARRRQKPVKPLLMEQGLIAGIGNIYADESLFLAGIHPLRSSASLDEEEIARLHRAIRDTLRKAIRLQGSSVDTYRDARGARGGYQDVFQVHRRQGEPCPRCGTAIEKIKVGGRGTYLWPRCQEE